jgi:TRAP-type transport system small permease protein
MSVDSLAQQSRSILSMIKKGIRYAGTGFIYVGIFLFVVLMFLDTADVIGRKFFDSPIIGTTELSAVLMGGIVLLGWSYAQRQRGHVNVDMFIMRYPPRARLILDIIMLILSLALFIVITYSSLRLAIQYTETGRIFPTMRITSVPYYYFVPVGGFFMCLELILQIIEQITVAARRV